MTRKKSFEKKKLTTIYFYTGMANVKGRKGLKERRERGEDNSRK